MEHNTQFAEITYHHEPSEGTRRIWRTFWILLVITIIELGTWFYYVCLSGYAWMATPVYQRSDLYFITGKSILYR